MSKNDMTVDILADFVKTAYLNSNKTINQIAIIFTDPKNNLFNDINKAFPEYKTIIFSSKSKPITDELVKSIDKGYLFFLIVDDVLDEESYLILEKIKQAGFFELISQNGSVIIKKVPEKQLIFITGSRDNLENQYNNLVNLGGNFIDIT